MDIFSSLLTTAMLSANNIQQIKTNDTREKWGVASTQHDYCSGRHLNVLANGNSVPFWIGLDIAKNDTFVTITFDRKKLNDISPNNKVASLAPAVFSVLNSNPQRSTLIERQLVNAEYTKLCNTNNPKILIDFMDEVLGAV
jgi:hypothetical protein